LQRSSRACTLVTKGDYVAKNHIDRRPIVKPVSSRMIKSISSSKQPFAAISSCLLLQYNSITALLPDSAASLLHKTSAAIAFASLLSVRTELTPLAFSKWLCWSRSWSPSYELCVVLHRYFPIHPLLTHRDSQYESKHNVLYSKKLK
jgi:hypothetical protein